jgi:hypothetical protein
LQFRADIGQKKDSGVIKLKQFMRIAREYMNYLKGQKREEGLKNAFLFD